MSGIVNLNHKTASDFVFSLEKHGLTPSLANSVIGNERRARLMMVATTQEEFFSDLFTISIEKEVGWEDIRKLTKFTSDWTSLSKSKSEKFLLEKSEKGVYDASYGFITLSARGDYSTFGKDFSEQKRTVWSLFDSDKFIFPNAPTTLLILWMLRSRKIFIPPSTIRTSSRVRLREDSSRREGYETVKDWHVVILVGPDHFHVYLYPDGKGRTFGIFPVNRLDREN